MAKLIVRDRKLLVCPGTRKLAVCAGSDPCGPGDYLCVVECQAELAGCPTCFAFLPDAMPLYPAFDHFKWGGRCWHVTGPYSGTPDCVVEVPEPSSLTMAAMAAMALLAFSRLALCRRKQ